MMIKEYNFHKYTKNMNEVEFRVTKHTTPTTTYFTAEFKYPKTKLFRSSNYEWKDLCELEGDSHGNEFEIIARFDTEIELKKVVTELTTPTESRVVNTFIQKIV